MRFFFWGGNKGKEQKIPRQQGEMQDTFLIHPTMSKVESRFQRNMEGKKRLLPIFADKKERVNI